MSALTYLTLTQFKNRIRGLVRSPAKLIYSIVVIALLVLVIVAGNMPGEDGSTGSPNASLGAIIIGYFALMFLLTANSGFSTGMSIFKMPDVNFLFVGPFKSVRVLFHGMFNQMATAIIMAVVILFQYGWMHGSYGVGVLEMVFVMAGYSLTVFTAQITAMVIYAFSSGRPVVRKALRAVYVVVTAAWAAYIGYRALGAQSVLDGICGAVRDVAESIAQRLGTGARVVQHGRERVVYPAGVQHSARIVFAHDDEAVEKQRICALRAEIVVGEPHARFLRGAGRVLCDELMSVSGRHTSDSSPAPHKL